jgi:hypothetical protein
VKSFLNISTDKKGKLLFICGRCGKIIVDVDAEVDTHTTIVEK